MGRGARGRAGAFKDPADYEFNLNVVPIRLDIAGLEMDTDNSGINEVDSVKDGSVKVGTLDSDIADSMLQNYFKFNATSEGSLDNGSLPGFYPDQNVLDDKSELHDPTLDGEKFDPFSDELGEKSVEDGMGHPVDEMMSTGEPMVPAPEGTLSNEERVPLTDEGIPPDVERMSPNVDELPPNAEGILPKVDQVMPSFDKMPPTVHQVPTFDNMVPSVDEMMSTVDQMMSTVHQMVPSVDFTAPSDDQMMGTADVMGPSDHFVPSSELMVHPDNRMLHSKDRMVHPENRIPDREDRMMPGSDRMHYDKFTNRSLITDYEEVNSLDKMWNMKTLMNDIKTEYNTKTEEQEAEFEADFKNTYLNLKENHSSDESATDEDPYTLDYYKFELEKMQNIVAVLKDQVVSRDREISRLTEKAHEYERWKSELEPNKQASLVQYKAENEAVVAVNFAKLQVQVQENERLTQRLMQMEETHRAKDDEIRLLRERILDNEVNSSRFDRDLKSLEIDKQMLKNSIESMERTFRQREMQLKLNLDIEYQKQISNVLKSHEQLNTLLLDKESEIEKCKELLSTARYECSQLLDSILRLKEVLLKKNNDIDHYKNKVIELESKLIANDKTSELKIARETQGKLRDRIRQLEQRLEMLQESSKVSTSAKEENLYLKAKIEKLENYKNRADFSQSVMELGNQMMPLSLANLRDHL